LRIQAEADVCARLRRILAGPEEGGIVVVPVAVLVERAERRSERAARNLVASGISVVGGAGPNRRRRNVEAAEREIVKKLSAHPEETVNLEGRARVRPPIFREHLFGRGHRLRFFRSRTRGGSRGQAERTQRNSRSARPACGGGRRPWRR